MKDYANIYEELPIQEGSTYYRLSELVDNLEIFEDTSGWHIDLPITEIRFIRPSHLRGDYRNCDIDYDSISKAPFMSGSYRSNASRIMTSIVCFLDDIYDTEDNYGAYAAFIDDQIKVGKISTHNKQIPISKPIAHFVAKPNGAAMTDYILRELTSDYALRQALQIKRLYNEVSRFDLYQIMIAVPSIDCQDEILASEMTKVPEININDDIRTCNDQLDDLVDEIITVRHNINQVWSRRELWRKQRTDNKTYSPFISSDDDPIQFNNLRRVCMDERDYKAFSSALYQLYYEGSHFGDNLPMGFAPRPRRWDDKTAVFPQLVMLNRHYFNHRNFKPREDIELTDDDLFKAINGGSRPKNKIDYAQMQKILLRKCVEELEKMQEYLENL